LFRSDAQARTSKPSSRARALATDTTRSLKECVGLAASFLTHTSLRPSRSASRSALISGVQPAGRPKREEARSEGPGGASRGRNRSEEHTSELQSRENLVCRLLLEKKKKKQK